MSRRPSPDEYATYHDMYIRLVPEIDIEQALSQQLELTVELLSAIQEEMGTYRYAAGKWSLKEVIGHIIDTERIMSCRLLRIARGDKTPLPGFEQDHYVSGAAFDTYPLADFIEEYALVRRSTLALLRGLTDEAWQRSGIVNDHPLSARALAYIIAGHELHHLNVMKQKYLAH